MAEERKSWMPIESAPRGEHNPVIAWNGVAVVPAFAWEGGWADCWYDWMDPQPTHWMPLPDAPTIRENGRGETA